MRAALALALLAAPAAAQEMTAAECAFVAAGVAPVAQEFGVTLPPAAVEDGWCVWRDLLWETGAEYGQRVRVERLALRGEALERVLAFGLPGSLSVVVDGLSVGVKMPMAQLDWVYGVQARRNRIDLDVEALLEPGGRAVRIVRAEADFPGENRVALTARATGPDFTALAGGLGGLEVPEAVLTVQTNGLFEQYALIPLATWWLPAEGDMAAAFAGVQAGMLAAAETLPVGWEAGARAELAEAVAALPAPSGTLTLRVTGAGPLPAEWLPGPAGAPQPDWAAALAGVTLGVTWTPEGD